MSKKQGTLTLEATRVVLFPDGLTVYLKDEKDLTAIKRFYPKHKDKGSWVEVEARKNEFT
jgi:hypothetical protein